ncbi:cold shock domain-containing protein [Fusicatenibacter saccharivorans]|nr:cold shock domain-containing protein [Fusicatenibacter saccharivorans]
MKTTGTVKWFDSKKGYGFIQTDEGADVFMHYSNIIMEGFRYLEPGDIVEYSAEVNEKGTYAVEVVPVLTVKMMRGKAQKDHMHLEWFRDAYGIQKWVVVDEGGILQTSEQGMNLEELNEYFS